MGDDCVGMGVEAEEYERPVLLLSPCDSGEDDMDNAVVVMVGFLVIADGDCHAKATPAKPITAEKNIINRIVIESCLCDKVMLTIFVRSNAPI